MILKCVPDQSHTKDIFEEYSNICTVCMQTFQCKDSIQTIGSQFKSLLKYLKGAASVNAWVHYEHLDKLTYSEFKAFTKEIQMMQQQFIIQELTNDSEGSSENQSSTHEMKFENSEDGLSIHQEKDDQDNKNNKDEQENLYTRNLYSNKISFAIFGSFTYQFSMSNTKMYKRYCHAAQSGFRTLGLVKPDNTAIIDIVLS